MHAHVDWQNRFDHSIELNSEVFDSQIKRVDQSASQQNLLVFENEAELSTELSDRDARDVVARNRAVLIEPIVGTHRDLRADPVHS